MISPASEQLSLSDFEYDLPEQLIAQEPSPERDRSRLMLLDRETGIIEHRLFADILQHLVPGDILVVNDTKVFPCRLAARKPTGGRAEIFLLFEKDTNVWEALVKGESSPGRKLLVDPDIEAEITGEGQESVRTVRFHCTGNIKSLLQEIGRVPLPPYIKRQASAADRERYQTVYASREGAVAAPTAGLHFTKELLDNILAKGIELATITLHVGPGTFQPVKTDRVAEHRMLPERYMISEAAAEVVNSAQPEGRRVIAVGTTSVRTLETAASEDGRIFPGSGYSRLFIRPGYRFRIVDGLVTNFHLPKSTLLMLVSAFAKWERVLEAYRKAVAAKYRFYSYGDAMLIL